jgi:hypothetical protein
MGTDFQTMIKAKHGDRDALFKMWEFFYPAVMGRVPDKSEAVLVFIRKVECFKPGAVNPAGWKFSDLVVGVTAQKNIRGNV